MPQYALESLGRLGDPTGFDAESLYLWGEGLRAMQRHVEALLPLERAARLAPEDSRISVALGWCYKRTGRLDMAIEALEKAVIREPSEAMLRYNLACYLSLAGHKRRALRHLSQTLKLEPAYCQMADDESDFEPIREDPEFRAICETARQRVSVSRP
jgi:Flp pilus assembly protein TadD